MLGVNRSHLHRHVRIGNKASKWIPSLIMTRKKCRDTWVIEAPVSVCRYIYVIAPTCPDQGITVEEGRL